MKIIYVHHAERDFSNLNDINLRQLDDINYLQKLLHLHI